MKYTERKYRKNVEQETGLTRSCFEHDACGIGLIVNIKGTAGHSIVDRTLKIVENLEHRAGKDADGQTGDGVGILLQISHRFFGRILKEIRKQAASKAEAKSSGKGGTEEFPPRGYGIGMFFFL